MSNPEISLPQASIADTVREVYIELDTGLKLLFEERQTFEDETILETSRELILYDTIQSVVAAHTQYYKGELTQKIAFEAFWLAAQIASVLPGKLLFNPGLYYKSVPEELYIKMASDAQEYLADKPYISTLIDENLAIIDPSGVHHVMIESFAAVTIMQFEQAQQDQTINYIDELDIELARILFTVDPSSILEEDN
jgi:hypothetical protein